MKYKNGRVVEMGDPAIGRGANLGLICGHIIGITEAAPSPGPGAPPVREAIRILTHVRAAAHTDASNATFNTVHDFGTPDNFFHAEDAFQAATPAIVEEPEKA